MVWQPERQPDHNSADLLSDQEDPNPWLPAALYTIEVKQSAKEAGELNEDMQTVPPLVTSLGDKSLADEENPRLARIKTRTLWWDFKIIHVPGKLQEASDAISRRNTSKVNVVWQPERQPDHNSADLLSDQEEPNPWLPAALYTIEVQQPAKEAES